MIINKQELKKEGQYKLFYVNDNKQRLRSIVWLTRKEIKNILKTERINIGQKMLSCPCDDVVSIKKIMFLD